MSRLTSQRDTEELPAVPAFTAVQIENGLKEWGRNLTQAKADGDIFAADTASTWLNVWLDRKNQAGR